MIRGPPGSHRWQVGSLVPAASLLLLLEDFLDLRRRLGRPPAVVVGCLGKSSEHVLATGFGFELSRKNALLRRHERLVLRQLPLLIVRHHSAGVRNLLQAPLVRVEVLGAIRISHVDRLT